MEKIIIFRMELYLEIKIMALVYLNMTVLMMLMEILRNFQSKKETIKR